MKMITPTQIQLYNDLLALTQRNDAFFVRDAIKNNKPYRVFSYRLASYTDFLQPAALEARGIMFELDRNGNPIRLASRPMRKFHNLNENPSTMGVNFQNPKQISLKADGSLISTYMCSGHLQFKSKTALHSLHAGAAGRYVESNQQLHDELTALDVMGYTVNCELTSDEPILRIVIGYNETRITILNLCNRETGEYAYLDQALELLNDHFGAVHHRAIEDHWIPTFDVSNDQMDGWVNHIAGLTGIEGYVVHLANDQLIKIKTDWYRTLHRLKGEPLTTKAMIEIILQGGADELRSMQSEYEIVVNRINHLEPQVNSIYNDTIVAVEGFYNQHKHLAKREYAIAGKEALSSWEFAAAIGLYLGREPDYAKLLISNIGAFDITDIGINAPTTN